MQEIRIGRRYFGLLLPFVAISLLVTLSGCGNPTDEPAGEPPLGDWRSVTDMATFTLPLDAYQLNEDQNFKVQVARNMLAAQCMRRFGFDIDPPVGVPPAAIGINERRYGLLDENRAQAHGYKVPEKTSRTKPPAPELTPEGDAILTGKGQTSYGGKQVPEGGCLGEAKRQMSAGGPEVGDIYYAQALGSQTYENARKDSRVRQAAAAWSKCMKDVGYNYADPMAPFEDPAFATETTTPQEIVTAVADARCRAESNLVSTWATVETAYQIRILDQHRSELDELKQALEARISNAAKVVGR